MEVARRRGRRRKKILDDLKERRGYSHLKEEALYRTICWHHSGGGFGPVVRQNIEWMMNSALGSVCAETGAQSDHWYGSGTLHPGQVLTGSLPLLSRASQTFTLFTTRCLHVRHDARDPRGACGNCGREWCPVIFAEMTTLLHAANLRHGTDGFTFPPKEGVLRIFSPSLKPRTWVLKASTLPLDHRRRFILTNENLRDVLGKADQPVAKGSLSFPDQLHRKTQFFPETSLVEQSAWFYILSASRSPLLCRWGLFSLFQNWRRINRYFVSSSS